MMRLLIAIGFLFLIVVFQSGYAQNIDVKLMRDSLRLPKLSAKQRIEIYNRLCVHFASDSFNLAATYGKKALDLSIEDGDKLMEGRIKLSLANAYLFGDVYDEALLLALDAQSIFEELGNKPLLLSSNSVLGWIYYDTGNPDQALQYHQQLAAEYEKTGDLESSAVMLNAVGLDFSQKNEHEKALTYFRRSLEMGRKLGSATRISSGLNNVGMSESALGNYENALGALDQSLQLSVQLGDLLKQAENLNQIGHIYVLQKQFEHAKACLERARALISQSASPSGKEKLLDNYEFASHLYEATNEPAKALLYLNLYLDLREELQSTEATNKLAEVNLWFTTQRKEQQIKLLENENRIQTLQRDALAGGILLLGVIGALVINRQRSIQRRERQIAEANEALMQKELERETLEKEALNAKLDFKYKEFTNFALHISQRNEMLRSFVDEIKSVNLPSGHDSSAKLQKVIGQFEYAQQINKEAEDFHHTIESEYKDFFFNLAQKFPDLTENERRLCAQVRLNLSIKDIASINNISVKSVEMARYRLRKRFSLDHDANLTDFLSRF